MTTTEQMQHFGNVAGEAHKREGVSVITDRALDELAEARRVQVCKDCSGSDVCATWGNPGACPSVLRRDYKRAYRKAMDEDVHDG